MGKVVSLEASAKGPAHAARAKSARKPRRSSKTALVLGGGGFTGAVYEIGALRALDLLSVNHGVDEFDVYVGTSAGAFVGALAASGITPEEMMRVIDRQAPTRFSDIELRTMLHLNVGDFVRSVGKLPGRSARLLWHIAQHRGQVTALDVVLGLAGALPAGIYSGAGIEAYLRTVLADAELPDDFRELAGGRRELFLTATDLDSCERIVFGAEGWDDVPISTAVRASTALPMVYEPVTIKGREFVDGGIVSTTNLDIAVEAGAKLIVVVNPLVPFVNDPGDGKRPARRVSDMGLPQVGYQSFKLMAYQRLHKQARDWERRYPGVDIVLIEPRPDDDLMFQTSVMDFSSRVEIARHGFETVTAQLADDYSRFKRIAERHGIQISATRVRKVVKHFDVEREPDSGWRKILEQTTAAVLRQSAGS